MIYLSTDTQKNNTENKYNNLQDIHKLQSFIYKKDYSRLELLNYIPQKSNKNITISVYRNHSFEMVEHTINAFLDFANISAKFEYSDYDDSLSFINLNKNSDLLILWLDISRYTTGNIESFIQNRLEYLSKIYKNNIIFVPFESDIKVNASNIITYDLSKIKDYLGEKYLDERLEKFSGTKLSPKASMLIAKDLGLNIIPSCIMSPIKAVIFDLDNTLYKGILGEDGYQKIELTQEHKKLQEKAVELSQQGFFICIASKNEAQDVVEMFQKRTDFPLKLDNITKLCASWDSKTESIKNIQKFLNIGIQDMLFVDDNTGEISAVKAAFPEINVILASENAAQTLEILSNYPRMLKLNLNYEDSIRQKDTQANEQRENLKNSLTQEEFLKTLEMEIIYSLNDFSEIKRISELSNKTNQFICSYKRYSVKNIEELMRESSSLVVSVSLKDKLSDSGIIGVLVFENKTDYINISECFISCRALGRGIDNLIVMYPIKIAVDYFKNNKINFNFTQGERNKPAEMFVDENLKEFKNITNIFDRNIVNNFVKIYVKRGK